MKKLIALYALFMLISINSDAQVWQSVKKNAAIEVMFPMLDSTNWAAKKTGLSPVDNAFYKDGAGAWTALAISDTAAEISGSTGTYEISLAAGEMNHDYITITFTETGASQQTIQFKTYTNDIDSALTVGALSANTITAAAIATGAVDADAVADDAIDAGALAANCITTAELNTGCISSDEIADNAIDAGALAANCIAASEIADNAIDAGALAADCITTAEIATGCISADEVADNAIDAGAIATGAITADEIAADAIGASEIAAGAITVSEAPTLDAAMTTRSSHAAADVWSVVARTLTALDEDTTTIDLNGSNVGGLTTWDKAGYSITGTLTTLDGLNTQLSTTHGAASWATATGFSTHSAADVWAVATRTLTAIDEDSTTLDLNNTQIGSIAGTVGTFDALNTDLSSVHGAGSWETGEAGTLSATDIWTYASRTLSGTINDLDELNTGLNSAHGSGLWGGCGGTGIIDATYTLTSTIDGSAISDALIEVYAETTKTTLLASGRTNQYGQVVFQLDAGTVYVWRKKAGITFTNPQTVTISE